MMKTQIVSGLTNNINPHPHLHYLPNINAFLINNKPKRLTSRDKVEPVDLSLLLISVGCQSQLVVDLSQLLISVDVFWVLMTDRRTDGLTTLVVKSLSRLKKRMGFWSHTYPHLFEHIHITNAHIHMFLNISTF